ncbi:hypothetical protein CDAR_87491 [Caerostris darwini]|uniref:C2H2-type domain-containing protein n=1 Tax=Caerostris darwini TaxID=1538125 RepID=A0AAV4UDC7_9ARAC|nr:hypothetical protein CDAR_87491 [Caerostris darwini]
MSSKSFEASEVLAPLEASPDGLYSPICHRTRSQLAAQIHYDIVVPSIGSYFSPASDSSRTVRNDSLIDDDVAVAVDELIQRISPSPSPPASHSPVGGLTLPPSTVPPISDSERNSPPPLHSPVGPDFDIKDSEQRVDPLKLCHDPDSDEVDLYPSDLEVRELFHDPPLRQKFDFVGLTCIECRRRFYSVGGFENHLLAAHDVRLDNPSSSPSEGCRVAIGETVPPSGLFPLDHISGPPGSPPFTRLSQVSPQARRASKFCITSSQPWAGELLDESSSFLTSPRHHTSPRRLGSSTPPRAFQEVIQSSLVSVPPLGGAVERQASFRGTRGNPDRVEHVVLLPKRKRRRKKLPCGRCDFSFRTAKSRQDHLLIHDLEDAFDEIHGISASSKPSDFADCRVPCPGSPLTENLSSGSGGSFRNRQVDASGLMTAGSGLGLPDPPTSVHQIGEDLQVEVPITCTLDVGFPGPAHCCHICDRGGFPNRKALRYHLFRVHRVPMGRREVRRPSLPLPAVSPAQETDLPISSGHGPFPLLRDGNSLFVDFPICGEVFCPEQDCSSSFVCKTWSSVVWSVKKHLRTHHNILDIRTCLRCGICRTDVTKPAKQHQCLQAVDLYVPATHLQLRCDLCCISFPSDTSYRNHLAGHKKADLREAVPKLSLPPPSSRKHKRRRKDAAVPVDIGEPSIISDPAAVLAQPVIQGDIVTCPDDPVGGPISHFLEQLDAFLADQVPTDAFNS